MSYDLKVAVKVEGCDKYAAIAVPLYDSPTYNLSRMFRESMNWDYVQGEYYPAELALMKIDQGLYELRNNREEYEQYNPPNGWGDIDSAIEALQSWRDCILDCNEEIPIECLYASW